MSIEHVVIRKLKCKRWVHKVKRVNPGDTLVKTQKQELKYNVKRKHGWVREEEFCAAAAYARGSQELSLQGWTVGRRQGPWGASQQWQSGWGSSLCGLPWPRQDVQHSWPLGTKNAAGIPQTLRRPEMPHTGSWWHSWGTPLQKSVSHWRTWAEGNEKFYTGKVQGQISWITLVTM